MSKQHALLNASGSKRWLACPPSVVLESKFPYTTSEAATEGTLAHSVAEKILKRYLADKPVSHGKVDADMFDYVSQYTDLCIEKMNAAKAKDKSTTALIEARLGFSRWVPGGFGTGDCVIISDSCIEIVDLKYGKGVPVKAQNNSQMQLYALGAIDTFGMIYDFDLVRMTIVQPRNGGVSEQEMTVKQLLDWADKTVAPTAKKAIKGEGETCAGEHCMFCRAAVKCKTYSDYCMEAAKLEFRDTDLLDDNEIALVLSKVDALVRYSKKIKDYALDEALKGKKWNGFKLVEGRSRRTYSDENKAAIILEKAGYKKSKIYKPVELLGITDMTKLLTRKKFDSLLGSVIVKPPGSPVLVTDKDTRPEFDSAKQDFKNLIK